MPHFVRLFACSFALATAFAAALADDLASAAQKLAAAPNYS
jgi:hypothetical protein